MRRKIREIFLFLSLFTLCLLAASAAQARAGREAPANGETFVWELGLWEGRVALFEAGADTPLHVFDTRAADLPAADRDALARGVPIRDAEELRRTLEDYF